VLGGEIYGQHARQVTTGFCELARAGVIDLGFSVKKPRPGPRKGLVEATIEGRRVIYDMRDGNNLFHSDIFDAEHFDRELAEVSLYFKRSCDPPHYAGLTYASKIRPLGLNYRVSSRHCTVDRGTLPFSPFHFAKGMIERNRFAAWALRLQGGRNIWIDRFERPPMSDEFPTVLFMARLWDTQGVADAAARQQREAINEMRAACVRSGREAFGPRFVGGLRVDEFSTEYAPDCLLPSARHSDKRRYLDEVRGASICVATTGLHGSIGWKMAEYVAASKAIVTEPLLRTLPGSFSAGRNYLEFTSPEGFVQAVERLLRDRELRSAMMRANWAYYRSWVRPDALVLNTIRTVLD
jgi:hypothetical protein